MKINNVYIDCAVRAQIFRCVIIKDAYIMCSHFEASASHYQFEATNTIFINCNKS